ncbi:MAG: hypothetical protein RMK57_06685 [Bryobacterales bacterium]|nr:hypothetical protein [Bryobacteraceae bacterium]MDW8354200.1 hypothetical protein [Bryobacterales bacterium]
MLVLLTLAAAAVAQAPPQLTIVNSTIHQFEDGPRMEAGHRFIPGETVFFSFQVRGFGKSKDELVHLRYEMDALDAENVRLVETVRGEVRTELAPQDKDWLPKVRWSFVIPPHAWPGTYRIAVRVKDELTGREAALEVPLSVEGRRVEPSPTLVIRNFRFLREERAPEPLVPAVYHPGQTLWARFDITGFKIGDKNQIRVAYRISILNAEGKLLYTQPEAAVEEDSPFYPKRSVPGLVSLQIQPGTPAGTYLMAVTVEDAVGSQTYETREAFRVE